MTHPPVITRFAPSPTGHLHLGHIYSALTARDFASQHGGKMRLRIDDIDHTRCRPAFTQAIYDDLNFMGIAYDGEVLVQSERIEIYSQTLLQLKERGLIYPCFLTRQELDGLLQAPHNTDTLISSEEATTRKAQGSMPAWRLRMEAIRPLINDSLTFIEDGNPPQKIDLDAIGDVVVARKDISASYHLSVVIDDAASGVTHVTRGQDLKDSTPLHRLLYELLDLPPPIWRHHALITDDEGMRLAKRDEATSIVSLRQAGLTPQDIARLVK